MKLTVILLIEEITFMKFFMKFENLSTLSETQFRRLTGVKLKIIKNQGARGQEEVKNYLYCFWKWKAT